MPNKNGDGSSHDDESADYQQLLHSEMVDGTKEGTALHGSETSGLG